MASIPACLLAASNFHEIVRVHVDQYGHIRGLWYQTMATVCPEAKPSLPPAPVQLVCQPTPLLPVLLPYPLRPACAPPDLCLPECLARHPGTWRLCAPLPLRVAGPSQVTSVSVDMESKGPKVLSEPVPKMEREEAEKAKQQQQGGGSFMQKYWYYIVAGLLLMSALGGEEPKGGGGGGGGGGGRR